MVTQLEAVPLEFLPPVDVVKVIGKIEGCFVMIPGLESKEDTRSLNLMRRALDTWGIADIGFQHRILSAFLEAVNNAFEHGNRKNLNKSILVWCCFGDKGVILGFRDEGSFFMSPVAKEAVENHVQLPSTKETPGGDGLTTIYELANKVFVSLEENTLYLAFALDGIMERQ